MSDATNEKALTCEAKAAIRKYMLLLVAIPGALLTIISGVGGFLINHIAFQTGYDEGYKIALNSIVQAAQEVGASKNNADLALASINDGVQSLHDAFTQAKKTNDEASETSAKAKQTASAADAIIQNSYEKIGNYLLGRDDFRKAAAAAAVTGFDAIRSDVDSLKKSLSGAGIVTESHLVELTQIIFKSDNQVCPPGAWRRVPSIIYVPKYAINTLVGLTTLDLNPGLAADPNPGWGVSYMSLCIRQP